MTESAKCNKYFSGLRILSQPRFVYTKRLLLTITNSV